MHPKRREALLKIGALSIVGLYLLDRVVLSSAIAHWKEQSTRIDLVSEKVKRGRQLMERGKSLRERWAEMQRRDLAENNAIAENDVWRAVGRWALESRITFNNMASQWRPHEDEGYDLFEVRATAQGDQASLGRLLYELETDALPARVHDVELAARDAQGKQLSLNLRVSFVRLADARRPR